MSDDNINAISHGYHFLGIPFHRNQRYFDDLPPFIMYGLCLATHTTLCYGFEVILYPFFDSKGFPNTPIGKVDFRKLENEISGVE